MPGLSDGIGGPSTSYGLLGTLSPEWGLKQLERTRALARRAPLQSLGAHRSLRCDGAHQRSILDQRRDALDIRAGHAVLAEHRNDAPHRLVGAAHGGA